MSGVPRPWLRDRGWLSERLRDVVWVRAALLDVFLAVLAGYAATALTAEV